MKSSRIHDIHIYELTDRHIISISRHLTCTVIWTDQYLGLIEMTSISLSPLQISSQLIILKMTKSNELLLYDGIACPLHLGYDIHWQHIYCVLSQISDRPIQSWLSRDRFNKL